MSYKAFISYSHAADDQLAPTLQSALQRFAKPFYRLRAINVFRDKTSLHLTPKLWPLIQQALRDSEYFILLASPDAASSPWVQAEVDEWLKLKSGSLDNFLIVLTYGEIWWDRSCNDFDWKKTNALPLSLQSKFATEPLFSDLRWARKSTDLSLRHPQFLDDVGTIAATLHGKSKDVMIGKDVRQHRVFKLASGAAILVLLLSVMATSVAAYYANERRKEADQQREAAVRAANQEREARDFADQQRIIADEQRQKAVLAAENERTAKEKETQQRKKAEDATKNEKVARQSAEERRVEAEHQRSLAEQQRQLAEEKSRLALSRQLTAQASNHLDGQFDLSLLLGLEAYRANATYEARRTLLTGLEHNPQLVTYLSGHKSAVHGLVFSPDGRTLISAGVDSTIRRWNVITGRPIGEPLISGRISAISSLALSRDGKTLASGGASLILWDITSDHPQPRHLKFSIDTAQSLAFSPDGKTLACGTAYRGISLWDVESGQRKGFLTKHKGTVWTLAFSPDGKTLASGSEDQTIILWDMDTKQPRGGPLTGQGLDGIWSIAFSRDGKTLASADSGKILLWDVATRTLRLALTAPAWLRSVAFGANDRTLVAGGNNGYLEEWWDSGGQVPQSTRLNVGNKTVWIVAFSPDGQTFASGSDDGTVILWGRPYRSGRTVRRLNEPSITDVAFSADGKILGLGDSSKIKLLNTKTGQVTNELSGHTPFAFSPDGTIVAYADSGKIVFWSIATGLPLGSPLTDHKSSALVFSPNGKILASIHCQESRHRCVQDEIYLWDVTTRQQIGPSIAGDNGPLKSLAISADSKTLAYVYYESEEFVLLDVATRKKLWSESGLSVAFSPDGQTIASGGAHGIFLWDIATHRKRRQLPLVQERNAGGRIDVKSVAFSSDGRMLLSTTDVDSVLWDVATRQPLWSSWGSRAVTLSPDSNTVAAIDLGGTVTLWDFALQSWKTRTCGVANRNLSWEEWGNYFGDEPYHKTCEDLPIHRSFLDEGRRLVTEGEFAGAVAIFRRAIEVEPSLNLDADTEVRRLDAIGKGMKRLEQVRTLLRTKEIPIKEVVAIYKSALAAYEHAIMFGPAPEFSYAFNLVCWHGSLAGDANELMDACQRAVAIDPKNWHSRDSRGLARALTGNLKGAIEDFEEFIKGTWDEEKSAQRQRWIDALREGKNPFTREVLQSLRQQ